MPVRQTEEASCPSRAATVPTAKRRLSGAKATASGMPSSWVIFQVYSGSKLVGSSTCSWATYRSDSVTTATVPLADSAQSRIASLVVRVCRMRVRLSTRKLVPARSYSTNRVLPTARAGRA